MDAVHLTRAHAVTCAKTGSRSTLASGHLLRPGREVALSFRPLSMLALPVDNPCYTDTTDVLSYSRCADYLYVPAPRDGLSALISSDVPEGSDSPDSPDVPDAPDHPDSPDDTDNPDAPEDPNSPDGTDHPDDLARPDYSPRSDRTIQSARPT